MEKQIVQVPPGVRYISDWEDFSFDKFPKKCIINKQIPGCGMTEYILTGPFNAILSSPRLMLMWNKFNQHKKDTYIVINGMESELEVDKDISKDVKKVRNTPVKYLINSKKTDSGKRNSEIYERLFNEISEYCNRMSQEGKYCKIIVTYDSYHIVQDILRTLGIYHSFKTFIDEFQSILHDARFKATTEMGFLGYLKQSSTAYFVSATPMLDDYIEMLDDFNTLPYYILDWSSLQPGRVVKPNLEVLTMGSVISKASEIIQNYLNKKFERSIIVNEDNSIKQIFSEEAVLFVNSVNHIISIIKRNELTPDQVNILCSDTDYNKSKIKKKLGKGFTIGSVPLEGEKHKMFTFCTRTTYLGADFYSTCARTFIFSDSNVDCLAVDISEDLPQILGRQRLNENPWKNQATFYYRVTADYKSMTEEDFLNIIKEKQKRTDALIEAYYSVSEDKRSALIDSYRTFISSFNYRNDYVAVNKSVDENGNLIFIPVVNDLVYVNELRSYKIQQVDYKDRFTVFSLVQDLTDSITGSKANDFLKSYYEKTTFSEKLKSLCESDLSKEVLTIVLNQIPDSDEIKAAYLIIGPDRLKETGYYSGYVKKILEKNIFCKDNLVSRVYENFRVGDKILLSEIKEKLSVIYDEVSYPKLATAKDLTEYFEVREIKLTIKGDNGEKKRSKSYEILDYKRDSENFSLYQKYISDQSSLQKLIEKDNGIQ